MNLAGSKLPRLHFGCAEQSDQPESRILNAERQLRLMLLGNGARMEQRQQLDAILRLHVVDAESEHLDQRMENAPGVRFRYARHHLRDESFDAQRFDFGVHQEATVRFN